jgi:hypothetical protein
MYVHVKVIGDTSFHPGVINHVGSTLIDAVMERVRRSIAITAPKRTGRLANSFYTARSGLGSGKVTSDLIYAAIQDTGGEIYPKNVTYLRFQGKDGHWVYTKGPVTIPATHYFTRGVEMAQMGLGGLLMEAGGKIALGMGFHGR